MIVTLAAAAVAATAPAVATTPATNITPYPAAYFATYSPTSALDMVNRLPGFTLDTGNQVRGFGGAAGNVLINGALPASKDDSIDLVLNRISASSVERIEVVRGGAPGIDMQGKTVLANVILRTDGGPKLTLAAAGTRAWDNRLGGAFRAESSWRVGQTAFEASIKAAHGFDDGDGPGPRVRVDGSGAPILQSAETNKAAYDEYRANGAMETPVAGGKLRLSASYSSQPYAEKITDNLTLPPGVEFERYHQSQKVAEFGLRFERPLTEKISSETFALQQIGRSSVDDAFMTSPSVSAITGDDVSDVFGLRKSSGESILREKLTIAANSHLNFEAGAEGAFNWLNANTIFIQDGSPVVLPAANVRVTEERGEGFGTATWTGIPHVTLEAGLRVEASRIASSGDVVSSQTFVFPKPRLAATWTPNSANQIRLRVEREVGQLNFDDFAASNGNVSTGDVHAGNPKLNPQQDWVFEGAFERKFWGSGLVSVTGRHYILTDVIDRIPVFSSDGPFDAPGNIGGGRKDELEIALTLPTDKIGLTNGLLTGVNKFRWSQVIDPTTHQPRPISALHSNAWEAHFTQGFPKWKATWGFDAFGQISETSYRFNEIDNTKVKAYLVLFGEYKPKADLILRAELRNAGGRGIETSRVVTAGVRGVDPLAYIDERNLHPGRTVYFRVTKTFG